MTERCAGVGDRVFEVIEMDEDAGLLLRLAVHGDTDAEGMSVHPRIGMAGGRRRKKMGGFEKELFIDAHNGCLGDFACGCQGLGLERQTQGKPSSLWVCRL